MKSPRQFWRETKASWALSREISVPERVAPSPPGPGGLRIAFLIYRGNPLCGGQGVYTRHLTRELVALGHSVEVFAGQPWPELDEGVGFTPVPGLDLYRDPDPFRVPHPSEFHDRAALSEFSIMLTAGFGEPLAFSQRIRKVLAERKGEFDIVHDNQCLGSGMLGLIDDGWPLLTTLHHPITVDRQLALDHTSNAWQQFTTNRWFGFLRMQVRVARRLPAVVTVSESSRRDISAQLGVRPERVSVVPVGVDHTVFEPIEGVTPVPGRLMVTSSSDVPLKGLVPLLEAVAKLRTERDIELVVIGRPRAGGASTAPSSAWRSRIPCAASAASATASSPPSTARRRSRSSRRSTRASRCRPSRRWPAGSPWSPPPVARSPRWWAPTVRPRCSSPRTTPARSPERSGASSTTPRCASGWAQRAASGCSPASPGA